MPRINRYTIQTTSGQSTTSLNPLFDRAVARDAKRLPIARVPEQNHVTTVRDDVVNDNSLDHSPHVRMHTAQRMFS